MTDNERTYEYAVSGAGGDDQDGHGTMAQIIAIAGTIIDGGQGEMAVWQGPGEMTFPRVRLQYNEVDEWAEIWRMPAAGVTEDHQRWGLKRDAIAHLTELLER